MVSVAMFVGIFLAALALLPLAAGRGMGWKAPLQDLAGVYPEAGRRSRWNAGPRPEDFVAGLVVFVVLVLKDGTGWPTAGVTILLSRKRGRTLSRRILRLTASMRPVHATLWPESE